MKGTKRHAGLLVFYHILPFFSFSAVSVLAGGDTKRKYRCLVEDIEAKFPDFDRESLNFTFCATCTPYWPLNSLVHMTAIHCNTGNPWSRVHSYFPAMFIG